MGKVSATLAALAFVHHNDPNETMDIGKKLMLLLARLCECECESENETHVVGGWSGQGINKNTSIGEGWLGP